jgi:hypothetical protein
MWKRGVIKPRTHKLQCECICVHGSLRVPACAQKQEVLVGGSRPPVPYDALSLDVGITPSAQGVPGALEHATPVKPVSRRVPTGQTRAGRE